MKRYISFCAVALFTGEMAVASMNAASATENSFYSGKTVSVLVGFSPGGGYDAYARLLSSHMGRHIQGKPTIIVKNMPGASSMKAVKYLYTAAKQDGTTMTAFNPGLIVQSLTMPEKIDVDFSKLRFLGSASINQYVCYFWHSTKVQSIADMVERDEVVIGATSTRATSYVLSALMKHILGAKVKHVTGYPGSAEQRIAIERGELDGGCGAWESIPTAWLKEKKAHPVVRFVKSPIAEMPELPYIADLAKSTEEKQILNLVLAPAEIGRPFVMGPNVPDAQLKSLRLAFDRTLRDEGFLKDVEKQKLDIIAPMSGAEVEAMINEIYSTPKETIQKSADYVK